MNDGHRLIRHMFVATARWHSKRVYDAIDSHPHLMFDVVKKNTLFTSRFMISSSFNNLVTIGLDLGVLKMAYGTGQVEVVPPPPKSRRWLRRHILGYIKQ